MTDIGIMCDIESLQAALTEAHSSIRQLLSDTYWNDRESWNALPLSELERASFNFHQLSTLLDVVIQERSTVARPQEEASAQVVNIDEAQSGEPDSVDSSVDGVVSPGEASVGDE